MSDTEIIKELEGSVCSVELHIPTEPYGFVKVNLAGFAPSVVRDVYDTYSSAFKEKSGLPDKEYNKFIDSMLLGEPNHIEQWELLSDKQRDTAQTIKRALKRLEPKGELRDRNNE